MGARAALDIAQPVEILLGEHTGHVLRPSLLAAILAKDAYLGQPPLWF